MFYLKKRKIKKKNVALLFLFLVFSGLFIFSTIKIINYLIDNKENRKIKEITGGAVTINESLDISDEKKYSVDFETLKKTNKDVVGYLKVNGTNIDYVVVKGTDNEYYLNHNLKKKYNISGWIFADYKNVLDGTDKNIVIYGHNTRDGSMFGTLKNALEKDWQENEENQKIVFVTEKSTSIYQVFSTYKIEPEEYYINTNFKNDDEYSAFLKRLYYRSNNNYGISADKNDTILTLSTCTPGGKMRVVVHAKKINTDAKKKTSE